jgi:hypothetical protein
MVFVETFAAAASSRPYATVAPENSIH